MADLIAFNGGIGGRHKGRFQVPTRYSLPCPKCNKTIASYWGNWGEDGARLYSNLSDRFTCKHCGAVIELTETQRQMRDLENATIGAFVRFFLGFCAIVAIGFPAWVYYKTGSPVPRTYYGAVDWEPIIILTVGTVLVGSFLAAFYQAGKKDYVRYKQRKAQEASQRGVEK